jgi:adenosylmethionine-8-amino-7-oxononanoate aminotransferase
MPLAATLTSGRVFDAFLSDDADKALMHGPTFMAHPIACATANASLDLFEREPRIAQAEALELALWDGLRRYKDHAKITDVRVKGAIGVLEFEEGLLTAERIRAIQATSITHGAWIRPFDNVLYLMPPLTISDAELTILLGAVRAILA